MSLIEWMRTNRLKLNLDNTEVMMVGDLSEFAAQEHSVFERSAGSYGKEHFLSTSDYLLVTCFSQADGSGDHNSCLGDLQDQATIKLSV